MKVCVVTGTRAEFGLLQGLMTLIGASENHKLQVVVTGTHLLEEFGHTVNAISAAGFTIDARVPQITRAVTGRDVTAQVGEGIIGFGDALLDLEPDAIVVLGDRYEMLAASVAAFFLKVPILHIHGGELTNGAFDDTVRHMITKLASLHCVAHEAYARRVIQLGEQPDTVHVVGGLGADQLSATKRLTREELEAELGVQLNQPLFLVTYHPVTSGVSGAAEEAEQLIAALEEFPDATVVITLPNADPEHQIISSALADAAARHPERWLFWKSLGQANYWSLMALATAVVGNSSSGILEAPSFPTPTVNIGPRQRGRIAARSVVSCAPRTAEISRALVQVMDQEFIDSLEGIASPFGAEGASSLVFSLLSKLEGITVKGKIFYDLTPEEKEPTSAL
jgi:UDP-hydrolysing UDP-N-acetyl-D-glucosamine 2-epimerase